MWIKPNDESSDDWEVRPLLLLHWQIPHIISQTNIIFCLELANDYAELGAVYNGFSLNENGQLANAIEKVGQAVDSSYTLTGQLVRIALLAFKHASPRLVSLNLSHPFDHR